MDMFVFTAIIWKEENGFSALCPEMDIASQGNTIGEARKNLLEAAALYLEGSFEDGLPYMRPVPTEEDPRNLLPAEALEIFKFKVDVSIKAYV
jgi:predicted RNase H-like HicB family nuclease